MKNINVLFIVGSANQTSQMLQIALHFPSNFNCYFSQFYTLNPIGNLLIKTGFFEKTVIGDTIRNKSEKTIKEAGYEIDYKGLSRTYDLVFLCTDMHVPHNLLSAKKVWVQEGMIDQFNVWARFVQIAKLPEFFALNTSLNGSTNIADVYCTASEGYSKYISKRGTDIKKTIATGIPNFDNLAQYKKNNFPFKNYILVCTSDIRELGTHENRIAFIQDCVKKSKGKRLIFKLHPNEIFERAAFEIRQNSPIDTLIFQDGNTNEMIANCEILITQWSSVAFVGLALQKETYSYFDMDFLKSVLPIQNGGISSQKIAEVGMNLIGYKTTIDKNNSIKQLDYELAS